MAAIRLTGFLGEQPKIIPRLLPASGAQAAFNARLEDGALSPQRKALLVETLSDADRVTIYRHGEDWLSWTTDVDAAPGPVASDRLYFTGDGVPKMLAGGTEYDLALDGPSGALTATLGSSGTGDVITRLYVYTWVTDFGEESEPSPASAPIDWQNGHTVTLSGFGATPSGRNITKQRIYRSQTGQSGTYFYLIAERAAATGDFTDDVAVDGFQEPLPSADWNPPPDGLTGLVAMPNGMMAGFSGKDLYFCEPWRPHAWPEKYVLTTDFPIVALGAVGPALVVLTTANPYLVVGTNPSAMRMDKIEQNRPCINKRAVADLGYAICYPSNDALVAIDGTGSVQVISATLFGRYEWEVLSPTTMVGAQYGGRYVAFYDTVDVDGADLEGAIFVNVGQNEFLGRARQTAQAAYYDVPESALYYVPVGSSAIYRFDAPEGVRDTLYWRSKQFWFGAPTNFGAIRIDADITLTPEELANLAAQIEDIEATNAALIAAGGVLGALGDAPIGTLTFGGTNLVTPPGMGGTVEVGVIANGVRIAAVGQPNEALRLPGGFTAETWEVDVSSSLRVTNIVMAETMDELKGVVG
jgi:hypothetical protein